MALKTISSVTKNFYSKKPSKRKKGHKKCLSVRKLPKSPCLGKSISKMKQCKQHSQMDDVVQCSRTATWVLKRQIKTSSRNKKQARKYLTLHHVSLVCSIESNQINKAPTSHKLKIWMPLLLSQTWTFPSIH